MISGSSRFNPLTYLVAGAVPALIFTVAHPAQAAKTPKEVADIAGPVTVQVNSLLGDGSGVIIARQGNSYTVLTVNHVVEKSDIQYTVRTSTGKNYPASNVTRLQGSETEPDLAVLKFESPDEYPVATLGNSDQAVIGSEIFVFGYPATGGLIGAEREPELSPGLVTSRPTSRPEGYNLRYQAVTWSGMSGGPVFDAEGRVIGLHGQGEFGFAQTSSGEVAPIKTGFNAAVPINLFIERLSQAGMNQSDLKVDNSATAPGPVSFSLTNPKDSYSYYLRGLSHLDEGDAWEAIQDFNKSVSMNPKNAEAYFNMGIARVLLTQLLDPEIGPVRVGSPIEAYTQAIQINPGYADAYYNRGLAYLDVGNKVKALEDLQKAAQLYQQGGRTDAYQEATNRIKSLQ